MDERYYHILYDDLVIGQEASLQLVMSEELVNAYSHLIGDKESFHVSEEAAQVSRFKRRVAHGVHIFSYVSFLIGTQLPGFGTIYLSQKIDYHHPVYIGEEIVCKVRVLEKMSSKRIRLETLVHMGETLILSGEGIVMCWR